jgi:hypothetical protein
MLTIFEKRIIGKTNKTQIQKQQQQQNTPLK